MVSYRLRVPPGYAQRWENFKNKIDDFKATDFQTYRIRRSGSTLVDVAKKTKVAAYVLVALNQIPKHRRLKRGQKVLLPFRIGQSRRESMYADLYERPRKSVLRRRAWRRRLKRALRRGKRIKSPTLFYTVKKGDSLWSIARRTGVSLDTLIASNYSIIKRRPIRRGDRLILK
jgi:membrane-bound lytic murein transglycosylase D